MGFLQAKSDLGFASGFRESVLRLWKLERSAEGSVGRESFMLPSVYQRAIQAEASQIEGYQQARETVAKGLMRAVRLSMRLGVPCQCESFPAPAIGGPVITVNMFRAVLCDTSHGGISRQLILDALNQLVGAAEDELARQRRMLWNPLAWVREVLLLVIRIPFMIVAASGFDVSKVEDHFIAKAFKLCEILAIAYVLFRLGAGSNKLREAIINILGK